MNGTPFMELVSETAFDPATSVRFHIMAREEALQALEPQLVHIEDAEPTEQENRP